MTHSMLHTLCCLVHYEIIYYWTYWQVLAHYCCCNYSLFRTVSPSRTHAQLSSSLAHAKLTMSNLLYKLDESCVSALGHIYITHFILVEFPLFLIVEFVSIAHQWCGRAYEIFTRNHPVWLAKHSIDFLFNLLTFEGIVAIYKPVYNDCSYIGLEYCNNHCMSHRMLTEINWTAIGNIACGKVLLSNKKKYIFCNSLQSWWTVVIHRWNEMKQNKKKHWKVASVWLEPFFSYTFNAICEIHLCGAASSKRKRCK